MLHFESKGRVEWALAASSIPHTVVAPTYFYDNALGGYQDLLDGVLRHMRLLTAMSWCPSASAYAAGWRCVLPGDPHFVP
jgi:hypothetical protein